jgi:thiamine-monophosphate kinase
VGEGGSPEDRLIAQYFRPLATHPGTFGFTDDCSALAPPPGHDLVLKTDGLIAGVHFFPDDPADGVARKALRVNLSDLAAKGAAPLGFLLAIALPKGFSESWLAGFTRGLGEDAQAYGCPLLGGDTDATPGPISISIAAVGTLPHGSMVRRAGAKVGDHVFVSGTIGDAALGLLVRQGCRSRAWPWPKPCACMRPPRWTCPTGWRPISPSFAAPPRSRPTSRSRGCRSRRPPRRRSPPLRP